MSDAGREDCPEVRRISPAARVTLLALALAFLSALPYFLDGGLKTFIPLDDETVIGRNEHVLGGLSLGGVVWAFTSLHASNWYPLTWLSHMAVVSLFGLDPWWHHAVNVALHAASASLLFLVMWRLTAKLWRSAFLAALFGIHPLHVESVAWVTERSDVL